MAVKTENHLDVCGMYNILYPRHCTNQYCSQMDTEQYKINVGLAVRKLRESLGKNQIELAEAIGVERTYITALENGNHNPSLSTLVLISKGLNKPLSKVIQVAEEL